ncbi:MAG: hypothetical protein ACI82H_002152, partial [Alphaproteobacteria bacterium]
GISGIVAALLLAALVAPSFIDWNAYRAEIATEVRKATGRKLTIDGAIDVALLPAPKLSATKVKFANLDGAHASHMARLDALDVRIAFWPLLSGKVVVSSVVLRGADIELESLADGRVSWQLMPMEKSAPASSTGGGSDAASEAVRLDQVIIERGRITYRDSRKGTVERIEGINARLAAATLSGPFVLRARAVVRKVPVSLEARTGRLSEGRPTSVSGELQLTDAKAKATFTGTFMTGAVAQADLKVEASGDNLADVIQAVSGGGQASPILARKFVLNAALAGNARTLNVNDITLQLNGTRVTGALNAALGTVTSVDATFGINTLDLDSWLAVVGGTKPGDKKGAEKNDAEKENSGKEGGFALSQDLRVAFDGRIGGVTFHKGSVRDVTIQGRMDRGRINLTRLAARLPGGSNLTLSGRLAARAGAPQFDGRIDATASDLRALFDWAGVDHGAIAPDRLRKASFRSGLGFAPGRVELRDMDMRFDSSRVQGGIVLALRDRIGIGVNLVVDRLNLDAYTVRSEPGGKPAKTAGGKKSGTKKSAKKGGGLAAFGAFDANIRAEARALTVQGMALGGVRFDGSLIRGDLTVKTLRVARVMGGSLNLTGKVRGLDKQPVPDLNFKLEAKSPGKLLALAGIRDKDAAAKLAPLTFTGNFKSEAQAARLDAQLTAGSLKLGLKGKIAGLTGLPNVALDFTADYPRFTDFMGLSLPGFTPSEPAPGAFSLSARAESAGLDIKLTKVMARLGPTRLTGTATLALAALRPKLTADMKADVITAAHFIPKAGGGTATAPSQARFAPVPIQSAGGGAPWTDKPLALEGLRTFDADIKIEAKTLNWRAWKVANPRIDATLANGQLDLRRVSGKTVGGNFLMTGMLAAPTKKGQAAKLAVDLDISRADLAKAMFNATAVDLTRGTVSFRMKLAGAGTTSRALASSLQGEGTLEAVEGEVKGFDLSRVNAQLKNLNKPASFLTLLQSAMSGGTTKFSKLNGSFKIAKGVVRSNDIVLVADGGTGQGRLVADLPKWRIDSSSEFRLTGHKDAPPFRMALKGPLDNPSRIFNLNELQSWIFSRGAGALLQQLLKPKKSKTTTASPTTETPVQPSQQPRQPKPEDFIRGIFDLLQKK